MFELPKYTYPELGDAPDCKFEAVTRDGIAPDGFHAMSVFPEYFRVNKRWLLAEESRMDCCAVLVDERIAVTEQRRLKKGDLVCVVRSDDGTEGVFADYCAFAQKEQEKDGFAFRQSRSRETSISKDYDELAQLLQYEKKHGNVLMVLGPVCAFDSSTRQGIAKLIDAGYVSGVMAGNALATHDLEAAYLGTALGQGVYDRISRHNGHYHHLETINEVRKAGSIERFIKGKSLDDGIMCALTRKKAPFVLVGSVRDDGPLPEVYESVYDGQDAMRALIKTATTIICVATTLHTVAAGNMTPCYRVSNGAVRPVYFYTVDMSEFAVNKLRDRGSVTAKGFVTNARDFIYVLSDKLSL